MPFISSFLLRSWPRDHLSQVVDAGLGSCCISCGHRYIYPAIHFWEHDCHSCSICTLWLAVQDLRLPRPYWLGFSSGVGWRQQDLRVGCRWGHWCYPCQESSGFDALICGSRLCQPECIYQWVRYVSSCLPLYQLLSAQGAQPGPKGTNLQVGSLWAGKTIHWRSVLHIVEW